ncbi:MAG: glycosyltransferase family 4 protein [Phycisphaerales bacterium]|nr:glycosyltransferase family 4 protein [Phycisphaerales bacterium]
MHSSPTEFKKKRIAVIAHGLRMAGGLTVGRNFIASLARVAPQHTYLFIIPAGLGYEEICGKFPDAFVLSYEHSGVLRRWFYDTCRYPRVIAEFKPDRILALGNYGLVKPPAPQAIFFHNAHRCYPLRQIKHGPIPRLLIDPKTALFYYRKSRFRKQLRDTSWLICQTEVMADRVRRMYSYDGEVLICPNAISEFVEAMSSKDPIGPPIRSSKSMILLCLTRYYTHKNLEGIIETFERFRGELHDVAVILTIAAEQHPLAAKLLKRIARLGLGDNIVNVGPIDHAEVGRYYRSCQGLLMPTLLESFGIYPEPMYFGVPILTSDLDFAHAVCGDAALYFDPRDPRAMRDAILRLKNDSVLCQTLVENGKRRLVELGGVSWDDNVRKVMEAIS